MNTSKDIFEKDQASSLEHKSIISNKPFLKKIYTQWYHQIAKEIPRAKGRCLEIGSGGGFMKTIIPNIVTSDVLKLPHCDLCCSAENLPFKPKELGAISMINVFHHINKPEQFLYEVERVLNADGKLIMIEPANTTFSRFIYKNFHHEPFDPRGSWFLDEKDGPLSGANGALPWIILNRDIDKFKSKFKTLSIEKMELINPFIYLLSGGLSKPSILPHHFFSVLRRLEIFLKPLNKKLAMFQLIVIAKKHGQ